MKKYVIITNDRGTVVEANCYHYSDDGCFIGRDAHNAVKINFTPKKKDRLHFNERAVSRDEYLKVLEYLESLEELERLGWFFRLGYGD